MAERCQGSGGKCPHEAVTTCLGLHICEMHAARLEWGRFVDDAPDFADNVPIERLRQIQAAGGLAKLLEAFDRMHAACVVALIQADDLPTLNRLDRVVRSAERFAPPPVVLPPM